MSCAASLASRPTGRKWRDRYLACGTLAHLGELSRRPHSSPRRSAPERERQVLELRQRYGWGARKLQRLLQESGVRYPATTVHRILKRHGLVNVNAPRPMPCSASSAHGPTLWQLDGKGPLKSLDGICQPLRSSMTTAAMRRVARAARAAPRGDPRVSNKRSASGLAGTMLMDRGTQWFSAHSAHGLTALRCVIKQGIPCCTGGCGHPQDRQGKVERFHGASRRLVRHPLPSHLPQLVGPRALEALHFRPRGVQRSSASPKRLRMRCTAVSRMAAQRKGVSAATAGVAAMRAPHGRQAVGAVRAVCGRVPAHWFVRCGVGEECGRRLNGCRRMSDCGAVFRHR